MPIALITGITGQDGAYLAHFLLGKGYEVHGLIRGQNNPKKHLVDPRVNLIEADLTDYHSLARAVYECLPHEVYNLGAITHVGVSFQQPEITANVTGLGCLRMLAAVRQVIPDARFYQASTSELFGAVRQSPQTELTPFNPRSPYGCAKAFAHYTTVNYRESYGMHASCGILFNHESPLRGYEFVTRKITQAAARIKLGLQDSVILGNLDSWRDWGFAADYVEAMWLMLQQDKPDDYVVATGSMHSIRELLDIAFSEVGIHDWLPYVIEDEKFKRPADVKMLMGDPSKAIDKLGWSPKTSFEELIRMMVQSDYIIEEGVVHGTVSQS